MATVEEIKNRIAVANGTSQKLNSMRQQNIGKKETLQKQLEDSLKAYNSKYGTSITSESINDELNKVVAEKEQEVTKVEEVINAINSGDYAKASILSGEGVVEENKVPAVEQTVENTVEPTPQPVVNQTVQPTPSPVEVNPTPSPVVSPTPTPSPVPVAPTPSPVGVSPSPVPQQIPQPVVNQVSQPSPMPSPIPSPVPSPTPTPTPAPTQPLGGLDAAMVGFTKPEGLGGLAQPTPTPTPAPQTSVATSFNEILNNNQFTDL